ncbi:hypothetical protein B0H13DRAFT_1850770 [Mycena leptocephala]|nr:hypothetical protein B0H13DRAFT_1850770 [Mycena leptocephala]
MRVLYLLWNAILCLGLLLSVLKRHDTPSTSILGAPCLVAMGDALAGVPAADVVGRIELHLLMPNKDCAADIVGRMELHFLMPNKYRDIRQLHAEAFAEILLLAERAEKIWASTKSLIYWTHLTLLNLQYFLVLIYGSGTSNSSPTRCAWLLGRFKHYIMLKHNYRALPLYHFVNDSQLKLCTRAVQWYAPSRYIFLQCRCIFMLVLLLLRYFKHTSVVPEIEFTHKHVGGGQYSRFSVAEVVPYHTGEARAWTTANCQVLYVSHGSAEELREQFSSDADRILCDHRGSGYPSRPVAHSSGCLHSSTRYCPCITN